MQNKDFTLIMNRLKDSFHPALLPLASSISIFRSLCSPRVAARRLICPASRLINACRRTRYPQMPFSLFSAWHCLLDHKVFCKIKKLQKHIALQTPLKTTKNKSPYLAVQYLYILHPSLQSKSHSFRGPSISVGRALKEQSQRVTTLMTSTCVFFSTLTLNLSDGACTFIRAARGFCEGIDVSDELAW